MVGQRPCFESRSGHRYFHSALLQLLVASAFILGVTTLFTLVNAMPVVKSNMCMHSSTIHWWHFSCNAWLQSVHKLNICTLFGISFLKMRKTQKRKLQLRILIHENVFFSRNLWSCCTYSSPGIYRQSCSCKQLTSQLFDMGDVCAPPDCFQCLRFTFCRSNQNLPQWYAF